MARDPRAAVVVPSSATSLASLFQLQERWQTAHEASVASIRALAAASDAANPSEFGFRVATSSKDDAVRAAAKRLPRGTISMATLNAALQREMHAVDLAAHDERLQSHLDELEAILEDMHQLARDSRQPEPLGGGSSSDDPDARLRLTASDRHYIVNAPLRCYECELAFKHKVARSVRMHGSDPFRPGAKVLQSLLLAWQCQPYLEPAEAIMRGAREADWIESRLAVERPPPPLPEGEYWDEADAHLEARLDDDALRRLEADGRFRLDDDALRRLEADAHMEITPE